MAFFSIPGYGAQKIFTPLKEGEKQTIPLVRNKRDVWHINTGGYKGAHFATFPPKLAETCILAGCPMDGIVLDPFIGSGTTGLTALRNGRHYIGIELNQAYCEIAQNRINGIAVNAKATKESLAC